MTHICGQQVRFDVPCAPSLVAQARFVGVSCWFLAADVAHVTGCGAQLAEAAVRALLCLLLLACVGCVVHCSVQVSKAAAKLQFSFTETVTVSVTSCLFPAACFLSVRVVSEC
jgi:hypothetical protein